MIGASGPSLSRALVGIFAASGTGGDGSALDRFLPSDRTTLCGFGRQALAIGLERLGIGEGDTVLLPGFVCRELLGAVRVVGADAEFYDVDESFEIVVGSLERASRGRLRAVIAVNYFGFPQPLPAVSVWCREHGVALIEDNAHGFLSADGDTPLGHRGDLGIFSLRKTLALPNGGALLDNRGQGSAPRMGRFRFEASSRPSEVRWHGKRIAKQLIAAGGISVARSMLGTARMVRRWTTGAALPVSSDQAESSIPFARMAPQTLELLRRVDAHQETTRRRELFLQCRQLFADQPDVHPLFSELPRGVVPQGFPFRYHGDHVAQFVKRWWRHGVPIVQWPDLPLAVAADAPRHYRQIMLVPFLW